MYFALLFIDNSLEANTITLFRFPSFSCQKSNASLPFFCSMVHRHSIINGTTTTTTTTTSSSTRPSFKRNDLVAIPTLDANDDCHHHDGIFDDDKGSDPHANETVGGTITAAVFGIIKGMVGPAVLYTPRSFADAGYAFALVALAASTALFLYSSQQLLNCWKHVVHDHVHHQAVSTSSSSSSRTSSPSSSQKSPTIISTTTTTTTTAQQRHYSNHAKENQHQIELVSLSKQSSSGLSNNNNNTQRNDADSDDSDHDDSDHDDDDDQPDGLHHDHYQKITYPHLAQMAYGDVGEMAVRTGICFMQLGICLTYFIFVPHNVTASMEKMFPGLHIPLWVGLVAMVGLEIPLCWIRDIRRLVYTNVAANALISFGLVSSLYLALFVAKSTTDAELLFPESSKNNDGSNATTLVEPAELSQVAAGTAGRTHLSPWNDHWYLFIGTSVRY